MSLTSQAAQVVVEEEVQMLALNGCILMSLQHRWLWALVRVQAHRPE